ncbi:hypothetical protein [Clostridium sp. YIM B02500]|uniref:hypothetical protein n=1 Tax=Clostridium sp. YIM B02500 TaxID=2910681 RepID=UPI001EEDEE38|nr:hypothetical protein [Clostridium sp. YIM B02500]
MSIFDSLSFDIDLKLENSPIYYKCKQNDTITFSFNVYDNGLSADLTGFSCILNVNKANMGYEIRDTDITISNNNIKVKCPSSTTQFSGDLKFEIKLIDRINNLQKTSFDIFLKVQNSILASSNGNIPSVIITPLEHLDESLNQIAGKIAEANAMNTTLINTKNSADNTNTILNATISAAKNTMNNLNNAIDEGNNVIDKLANTNWSYIEWIGSIVEKLAIGTLDDENGTPLVDENNEQFIG